MKKHFFRRNGEESRSYPSPRSMVCALSESSELSELSELSEKFAFFPSALAPSSLVLWRMEPPPGKSMGLCAPYPQQVRDLHLAENA